MDSKTQTNKGMKISSKTRVKVAGLINDLHLLQSLPGSTTEVAKNYRLGTQFMKYLKELDVISTKNNTVLYVNPKNHSTEYILDYVMSRYLCDYGKEIKADTPSDLVTCEVELPAHMKGIAQEAIYKNQIRNLQSDLNRQEAYIQTLKNELNKKYQIIGELTKKKSIFAKIKNLLS
jgi:hypothetical protein